MTVESASFVGQLNSALPDGSNSKSEGDDHMRLIKGVLQGTFPNFLGRFRHVQTKSANYTLVPADNTSLIVFTAGTQLLGNAGSAAAVLGDGWHCLVMNATGGNLTFDPNAAELVNGAASAVIPVTGILGLIICDGTQFFLFNLALSASAVLTNAVLNNPSIVGVATGNITGSSGSCSGNAATSSACSGNAATATKLATARAINGVNFDGTGAITTNYPPNFTSAEQTLNLSTDTVVAHGLGVVPNNVQVSFRCKTAELGYNVGDEIPAEIAFYDPSVGGNARGSTIYKNATNVGLVMAANAPTLIQRGGSVGSIGSITLANWKFVVRCWV